MPTRLAVAYTGRKSRFAIYRAVATGRLVPIARHGREMIFSRASLDRFVLGLPPENAPAPTLRVIDGGKRDEGSDPQGAA